MGFCVQQNIEFTSETEINNYGWAVWTEKKYDVYFWTAEAQYFIDYNANFIFSHRSSGSFYFNNPSDLIDFNSIYANNYYTYLQFRQGIQIYGNLFWQYPSLNVHSSYEIAFMRNEYTKWSLGESGLFSVTAKGNQTIFNKQGLDGKDRVWNINIPIEISPHEKFHMCECSSMAYLAHGNQVFSIDSPKGIINLQWEMEYKIAAITCSSDSIFLLCENSKVLQFSSLGNYIFTYQVRNKKIPKYNQLQLINGNLVFVLCDEDQQLASCVNPIRYYWTIIRNPEFTNFTYSRDETDDPLFTLHNIRNSDIEIRKARALPLYISSNISIGPNSYLDIASRVEGNLLHLAYFSGGGDITKPTCEEMRLYYLEIDGMAEDNPKLVSMKSISMNGDVNHPISDYASVVLNIAEVEYFLIHGGISCDCENVFSDLFAIDLWKYQYLNLFQNETVA
jgi:hypothetical protein